jgi:hypothetical protein
LNIFVIPTIRAAQGRNLLWLTTLEALPEKTDSSASLRGLSE